MGSRRSRAWLEGTLQDVRAVPWGFTPIGAVPQIATGTPTAHTSHKLRHTTLTLGNLEVAQRSTLLFRPTRVQVHTIAPATSTGWLIHPPSPHAPALASDRHGHPRRPPGDPPRPVEFGGCGRAGLGVPRRTAVCAAKCSLCTERRGGGAAEPERRLSPQTVRPRAGPPRPLAAATGTPAPPPLSGGR